MRKSRFSEEQIAYALRQVESGVQATEVCRKMGVSEETFYILTTLYFNGGVPKFDGFGSSNAILLSFYAALASRGRRPSPDAQRDAEVRSRYPKPTSWRRYFGRVGSASILCLSACM